MKIMINMLLGVIISLHISCNKDIPPPSAPCLGLECDTTELMGKLDTLWTAPLPDNKYGIISDGIFYINNHIIFLGNSNIEGYVTAYNSINGENKWVWKDIKASHFPNSQIIQDKEVLIVQNRSQMGQIDLKTGTTLKLHTYTDGISGHSFGQILGEHYYYSQNNSNETQANLVRSSLNDFTFWETLYQLNRGNETGNSRPNIQSYNLWVNPSSGDSILIFQHRMAFPNRVDVLAYNLKSQQIEWKHENLTKDGNSNHQQIFLHDNKAYFGGSLTYYCFDMFTGKIIWEYDHPNQTTSFMVLKTIYIEKENAIIVKAGGGLFSFHPETGKLNYSTFEAGGSTLMSGSPSYHDGILYYTANSLLYAVRASSGTVLWSERSSGHPMGNTSFGGDVAIDPERRVLYATNDNTLFAIKLFEP